MQPRAELGGLPENWAAEQAVTFSADGRRLGAVLFDPGRSVAKGRLVVWDSDSPGRPIASFPAGIGPSQLALSDDGAAAYVLGQGDHSRLQKFDVASGALLASRDAGIRDGENALAIAPDGSTLAVNGSDGVLLLDTADLRKRRTLPALAGRVSSLAFLGDRRPDRLRHEHRRAGGLGRDGRTVRGLLLSGHAEDILDLAFSADGTTVFTVSTDGVIIARDVTGSVDLLREVGLMARPRHGILSLPSPSGGAVAYLLRRPDAEGLDIQFRTLAPPGLTPPARTALMGQHPRLAWSPDATRVVTAGTEMSSVQLWDPVTGRLVGETDAVKEPSAVAFTSDGNRILVGTVDGTLVGLDAEALLPSGLQVTAAAGARIGAIRPSPDDTTTLVLPLLDDGTHVFVDSRTGEIQGRGRFVADEPFAGGDAAWSPDGRRIAVTGIDQHIGILDAESGEWVSSVHPEGLDPYLPVEYAPDGSWFAVGEPGGTVSFWHGVTAEFLGELTLGPTGGPPHAKLLDDGTTLMVTSPDGKVQTWDTRPEHAREIACTLAGTSFTPEEWAAHVGDQPYRASCRDRTGEE